MTSTAAPTVLIVPGLRDHVPEHWQTLLEQRLDKVSCVPRRADDKLSCARWVEAIEQSLARIAGPVILVAHSGGVMMVIHWARKYRRPIHGALLATPADLESPLPAGYPTTRTARAERLAADPAPATAVPEHRGREHQRSARPLRPRRRNSPLRGAAALSTSAMSGTSIRPPATARGRAPTCWCASCRQSRPEPLRRE